MQLTQFQTQVGMTTITWKSHQELLDKLNDHIIELCIVADGLQDRLDADYSNKAPIIAQHMKGLKEI